MSLVGAVIGWVLTAFIVVLVVRVVVDWAAVATNIPPWARRVRMVTHATTEPVIAPVRRVAKPIRAGGVAFDLAFTIVLLVALILRSIAFAL